MKKTVLLTGFEPFDGATINPAWEAVRRFRGWVDEDYMVEILQLPCVFGQATRVLCGAVDEIRPGIVLCVGQAGGRDELTLERVAVNCDDAPIQDNEGQQPVDTPIVIDGPETYLATLPVDAIVDALCARGLTASVSETAGSFVCNHVFYGLMHHLEGKAVTGGLMHVPYLPEQAAMVDGAPSMALSEMIEGLRIAMEVAVRG
jgi:pyroglutamyl-peptidase